MATLKRGIKLEITKQLSRQSAETFAQWIGCYGVIWNCKVAENQEQFKAYRLAKILDDSTLRPKPNQRVAQFLTEERPWLKLVPSQIRRNAGTKFVEALNAWFKGLRQAPNFKSKYSKKNCLVTNELFDVKLGQDNIEFDFKRTNKSKAFCSIVLPKSEKMFDIPKTIWVTRKGFRFWLSWSYNQELLNIRDEQTIINQLKQAPANYQTAAVIGIDMGIVQPVTLSDGQNLGFTLEEEQALQAKQLRRLKYQRKLSRQRRVAKTTNTKTGNNYQKTKSHLADQQARIANTRINMAHRVSKIIADSTQEIVVCENLIIKNMTKRPKAKQELETKQWIKNGASAKAGLNKSILNIGWGRVINYLEYKLRERDKLLVKLSPKYSSQECVECGHIAAVNRKTQAVFCCVNCSHTDNADHNAACVLKKRFLQEVNTGKFVVQTKTVKRIAIRKQAAARMSASVCGAKIRPILALGTG